MWFHRSPPNISFTCLLAACLLQAEKEIERQARLDEEMLEIERCKAKLQGEVCEPMSEWACAGRERKDGTSPFGCRRRLSSFPTGHLSQTNHVFLFLAIERHLQHLGMRAMGGWGVVSGGGKWEQGRYVTVC